MADKRHTLPGGRRLVLKSVVAWNEHPTNPNCTVVWLTGGESIETSLTIAQFDTLMDAFLDDGDTKHTALVAAVNNINVGI